MINHYHLLLLFFITVLITSQSCCDEQSICSNQSTCLCDSTGIDTCMMEISDNKTFKIGKGQDKYFYWRPKEKEYNTLKAIICVEDKSNATLYFAVDKQKSDGTGYPKNKVMEMQFEVADCWEYTISEITFCETLNGQYCKLLMSTKLVKEEAVTFSISIITHKIASNYLIPILIISGLFIIIFLSVTIIYVIRKKVQTVSPAIKIDTTSIFDKYAPKIQVQKLIQSKLIQSTTYNCSICFNDILPENLTRLIPCKHILHSQCLDNWYKVKPDCPMCRQSLSVQNLQKSQSQIAQTSKAQLINNQQSSTRPGSQLISVFQL